MCTHAGSFPMKMDLSFSSSTLIVFSGNFELLPSRLLLLLLPIPPTNMDVKSGILNASCRRAVCPLGAVSAAEGMWDDDEDGDESSSTGAAIGFGRIR